MVCLKCGKKTKENRVFCDRCLTTMEAYPVKPDVHIQLPNRSAAAAAKKAAPKRRQLSAEEQVTQLNKRVRVLALLVVVLSLLVCLLGFLLLDSPKTDKDVASGTNYTYDSNFK